MGGLSPLSMSQTKEELLKHLNLDQDTYIKMAKETGRIYQWLTSEKHHLKKNCKRKPPYDWSDILERSKDEAMERIVLSSDPKTSYYWNLASPSVNCPNWIARWFLYHKFRYRDGRNRNPVKEHDGKRSSYPHSSKQRHDDGQGVHYQDRDRYYSGQPSYQQSESMTSGSGYQTDGYDCGTDCYSNAINAYSNDNSNVSKQYADNEEPGSSTFYDPVRDTRKSNS